MRTGWVIARGLAAWFGYRLFITTGAFVAWLVVFALAGPYCLHYLLHESEGDYDNGVGFILLAAEGCGFGFVWGVFFFVASLYFDALSKFWSPLALIGVGAGIGCVVGLGFAGCVPSWFGPSYILVVAGAGAFLGLLASLHNLCWVWLLCARRDT